MRQNLFTAFMLFSVIYSFGQHTIKGKVLDENGTALAGASVVIQNSLLGQTTNKEGFFTFEELTKLKYSLKISFIGYQTSIVQADVDREMIFKLKTSTFSINEITVNSLRASDKSPVAFTNIDKETLQKSNLGQDIPYLLSMTPSFVASSDAGTGIGYTGFRIRGTDASRINVTINGIPYNDPDEQGTYWVDLPDFSSSLESVQIQRGVGTSTNGGGAFGANINLQTDNFAQKASGELNFTLGSFNTQKATVKASSGLINNHWAIDARLSSVKSDGYIDRGSVDMKSYFIQAGYYGEKTTLKFLTFGGTEKTYHAWDGVPLDSLVTHRTYNPCGYMGNDANGNPLYYQNQTDNYVQTNYQLVGVHVFSSELSLNAGLHYTRGDGYYEEYKQNQSLQTYSINPYILNGTTIENSDLVRQKKMGNDFAGLVYSLNYKKNDFNLQLGGAVNNYWGNHWGDVIWVKNYIGDILPITEYYRSNVNKLDGNIYLKGNYQFSAKWSVYADLQYRHANYYLKGTNDQWDSSTNGMQLLDINKSFDFLNPKIGTFYRPDNYNDVFASVAIAHREPTRTNYTDGSPSTAPTFETLYDTEVGYKFHNDLYSFGVNGYLMFYKNQLILTGRINDIGEMLTENIPESYRSGIELTGSIKPIKWFRWDVSSTISYNRIINFHEFVDVYDANWNWTGQQENSLGSTPIAFSPEFLANSLLTFTKGNFEAGLQSQYVGKQFIDNTGNNDRSLKAYFVNNLRLTYNLPVKGIRGIGITALINNINGVLNILYPGLFNEHYVSNAWTYSYYQADNSNNLQRINEFGFFPQAGINLLIGINVKL
jgi:iron complex outermembrane receptor protein